ncbi:ATP-dependent nuclease [Photobacterium swingsii]|uniref:ATP-dependent nuclease n=1 Tax=Photobacterium swingsii TaxID=680026 RepID=UPI003D147969
MHIKSLDIKHFRKFGNKNNKITFVEPTNKLDEESTVSASTSLIVGKNNSGKTTVAKALELVVSDSDKLSGHDFNYDYLSTLLSEYKVGKFEHFPEIEFKITFSTDTKQNFLTNIGNILSISDVTSSDSEVEFDVVVKYEVKNNVDFEKKIRHLLTNKKKLKQDELFRLFIGELNVTKFRRKITDSFGYERMVKPSSIIELKSISAANNIHDRRLLSKSFNKIIKFKYESNKNDLDSISNIVDKNNEQITSNITQSHKTTIQNVLDKIILKDGLGIDLRAELTFDRLMDDLITYEHKDGDYLVPEGQFGLGYANLISIVSEIIDYIERTPKDGENSKVRLICIEEPEAFMHPQMQVNFIRHIDEAVKEIIGNDREINSQILITTHSAHILNSKIHSSSSLNDINYIYPYNNHCENVAIKDEQISENKSKKDEFYFIKKHIKHQVPELFFADAIILVEGITEERLLNFYIERCPKLSKRLVSVFRIDGAHGKVYEKLLSQLKIPSLIITDIDYKRLDDELYEEVFIEEKNKSIKLPLFPQMKEISKTRQTTNSTLSHFFNKKRNVIDFKHYPIKDNIMVVFQKDSVEIKLDETTSVNYYATSLEEAMVLENYDNSLLRTVLEKVISSTYLDIIPEGSVEYNKLAENSFRIQKSLASEKSNFANSLIYHLVINDEDENLPDLPKYINEGLKWLETNVE